VRSAFENYFGKDYVATDFLTNVDPASGQRYNRYILQRLTPALQDYMGIWL
jgi:hypothetical protein